MVDGEMVRWDDHIISLLSFNIYIGLNYMQPRLGLMRDNDMRDENWWDGGWSTHISSHDDQPSHIISSHDQPSHH